MHACRVAYMFIRLCLYTCTQAPRCGSGNDARMGKGSVVSPRTGSGKGGAGGGMAESKGGGRNGGGGSGGAGVMGGGGGSSRLCIGLFAGT